MDVCTDAVEWIRPHCRASTLGVLQTSDPFSEAQGQQRDGCSLNSVLNNMVIIIKHGRTEKNVKATSQLNSLKVALGKKFYSDEFRK